MSLLRQDRRPLATQVRDRIWDMMQDSRYQAGDQLPSEQNLIVRFGVSRATVREALRTLQEERLIVCRHGAGRFVAPDVASVLSEEITRLQSVTEMARGLGIAISTRVLSLSQGPASETSRSALALAEGETVVILERVRLAADEPVIFSIDIVPRSLVRGEIQDADVGASLISVMEEQWGIKLAYSKAVLSAEVLDPELSERIGVPGHLPWIVMEQINYDADNRPILYSKDYHRGDKFRFRVLRRRR